MTRDYAATFIPQPGVEQDKLAYKITPAIAYILIPL